MKLLQLLALAIGGAAGWILAARAGAAMDANPLLSGIRGPEIAVFAAGIVAGFVFVLILKRARQ